MTLGRLQQGAAAARWLALAASAVFALGFVAIALLRIRYPFELEWMEGGLVDHVGRALAGQPIFVEPSIDFIAFLYPPLYYYVAALPAAIFGTDFFALRLLSFGSCLGASFLLYRFVQRETGARDVAAVSAALFLATFDRSGGWFDLARIDSFFLLLLMSGLFLVRFAETKRQVLAAGLLLAGATLVKQSTLAIVAPLMLYSAIVDTRRAAQWIGTLAVTVAASWLMLDVIHDGWFSFYCVTLPRNHPVESTRIMEFWSEDFTGPMKIACAFAQVSPAPTTATSSGRRRSSTRQLTRCPIPRRLPLPLDGSCGCNSFRISNARPCGGRAAAPKPLTPTAQLSRSSIGSVRPAMPTCS